MSNYMVLDGKDLRLVNAQQLREWIADNDVTLIDVREPEEHQSLSIPGAILIPLGSLSLDHIRPYRRGKIVFHCQVGRRSGRACQAMLLLDPALQVYTLDGGLDAWAGCGFECR